MLLRKCWCVSAHLWVWECTHLSVRVFLCVFGCRRPFCASNDDNSWHSFWVYCVRHYSKSSTGKHTWMSIAEYVSRHMCQWVPVSVACQLCPVRPPSLVSWARDGDKHHSWPDHSTDEGQWSIPAPHPFPRLPVSLNRLGLFFLQSERANKEPGEKPTNHKLPFILQRPWSCLGPRELRRDSPARLSSQSVCHFLLSGIYF